MSAGSCWERACATTKEKNVNRPRDGLDSGSRQSRCAPRRRRGPSGGPRSHRGGGLEAVKARVHLGGYEPKKYDISGCDMVDQI
eukprot:1984445-Prymnesium_polylepis.1